MRGVVDAINMGGYLNAAMGYGVVGHPLVESGGFLYLSSEGFRGRLVVESGTWQAINKYIVKWETMNLPAEMRREFMWVCYNRQYTAYLFAILILLLVVVYVILLLRARLRLRLRNKIMKRIVRRSKR